jgi:uncharacterized membrane protein YdjX (TVP38/TMEM64 family)
MLMDTRRFLLYVILLSLPTAVAASGSGAIAVGLIELHRARDLHASSAPLVAGSVILVVAVICAVVVIRNERRQHREMMAGLDHDEQP